MLPGGSRHTTVAAQPVVSAILSVTILFWVSSLCVAAKKLLQQCMVGCFSSDHVVGLPSYSLTGQMAATPCCRHQAATQQQCWWRCCWW